MARPEAQRSVQKRATADSTARWNPDERTENSSETAKSECGAQRSPCSSKVPSCVKRIHQHSHFVHSRLWLLHTIYQGSRRSHSIVVIHFRLIAPIRDACTLGCDFPFSTVCAYSCVATTAAHFSVSYFGVKDCYTSNMSGLFSESRRTLFSQVAAGVLNLTSEPDGTGVFHDYNQSEFLSIISSGSPHGCSFRHVHSERGCSQEVREECHVKGRPCEVETRAEPD